MQYYRQALDLTQADDDLVEDEKLQELGRDHLALGKVLFRAGETSAAQKEFEQARDLIKQQPGGGSTLEIQSLLAETHLRKGEFREAEKLYQNSVDLMTSFKDFGQLDDDMLGLIKVKGQSGDYEQALSTYQVFKDLGKEISVKSFKIPGSFYREAAFNQFHLGQYGTALESLEQAHQLAQNEHDIEQQAAVAMLLAEYYLERPPKRLEEAWNSARDARLKFEEVHDPVMSAAADNYLARVDIEQHRFTRAQEELNEASQGTA